MIFLHKGMNMVHSGKGGHNNDGYDSDYHHHDYGTQQQPCRVISCRDYFDGECNQTNEINVACKLRKLFNRLMKIPAVREMIKKEKNKN